MDLDHLNAADPAEARAALLECCASAAWADTMVSRRPFGDVEDLTATARQVWQELERSAWLEAFAAHPRIGERLDGDGRFASWSRAEQAGAEATDPAVVDGLVACNLEYEDRFGHVFLVFATGKTADELLAICRARLDNDPPTELGVAAAEQAKITDLRLRRLLGIG